MEKQVACGGVDIIEIDESNQKAKNVSSYVPIVWTSLPFMQQFVLEKTEGRKRETGNVRMEIEKSRLCNLFSEIFTLHLSQAF